VNKLLTPIDEANYSVAEGAEAAIADFDTTATKMGPGKAGVPSRVTVHWVTDRAGYVALRSFYLQQIAVPFLIDLILDQPYLTEHVATFVSGTFKLESFEGLTYSVTADLFAMPYLNTTFYDMLVHNIDDDMSPTLFAGIAHLVHSHLAVVLPYV
jgi:hypothetical protein